jgi:hypothetical protein
MEISFRSAALRFLVWLAAIAGIIAGCSRAPQESSSAASGMQIPADVVVDKIRGGMLGQILGNLNGLQHEFKYIDEPGQLDAYVPSLPQGAWTDDDTDFEWVYIVEMQRQRNLLLPPDAIAALWRERINDRIWCANRYARYLMDLGFVPPYTGWTTLNPWSSFNISGTFLAESFALMAPAMPQTASRIALNYTTVGITAEPAQTTQFLASMIAMAFVEDDVNALLDAGVAALAPNSRVRELVNDIRTWHREHPNDWRETRRLLQAKYTQEQNNMRDRNGYELNTGASIVALLYGNGDFADTLRMAFNLGWDADNVAANVGTILGVVHGYRQMLTQWDVVDRYRNTTRDNMPDDETITSYADRLVNLFELVLERNGGRKTLVNQTTVYEIPAESAAPVLELSAANDERRVLLETFEQDIRDGLRSDDRQAKARAAYLAVTLGTYKELREQAPEQWQQAVHALSGYWKVMRNIFQDSTFADMVAFRQKFREAGFQAPTARTTDQQLYGDPEWKDPATLY